ncbi:MAG: Rieske 2Fe-2S domain-containing protein [Candidatus Tectomicrobia bacterium]|nr:Rieske 2Fe-2S domain-containing protein [Candidatus Tectomicrobia bacterium]
MATTFIKVAEVGDIPEGEGRVISTEGEGIALFHVDGKHYAIGNTCAHIGGRAPLGEGFLNGYIVACPYHYWEYDVRTGTSVYGPRIRVPRYEVKVIGSDILVGVPDPPPEEPVGLDVGIEEDVE